MTYILPMLYAVLTLMRTLLPFVKETNNTYNDLDGIFAENKKLYPNSEMQKKKLYQTIRVLFILSRKSYIIQSGRRSAHFSNGIEEFF